ncbi:hypothetical protein, partial [Geomesophilobacter sediminis]|uniref:hypothetical protein n=1 Tax=Geomesophilobacter sediminis TaxID=2798584 RepID=UPI001C070669
VLNHLRGKNARYVADGAFTQNPLHAQIRGGEGYRLASPVGAAFLSRLRAFIATRMSLLQPNEQLS